MSSDLVQRLMTYGDGSPGGILLMRESAARIEAFEAEVAALTDARDAAIRTIHGYMDEATKREARAAKLEAEVAALKADVDNEKCFAVTEQQRAEAAEARAARLLEALTQIKTWTHDQSAERTATKALDEDARKAIEDDKQ